MYTDEAKIILDSVTASNTVIVIAHSHPDPDAYGSQLGLFLALKNAFPKKDIFAVASEFPEKESEKYYSDLTNTVFEKALVIITDTPAPYMAADERYKSAEKTIVIDHHAQRTKFGDYEFIDTSAISACQMIYFLLEKMGLSLDATIARYLMTGLISDSGRFRYQGVSAQTFYAAYRLMKFDLALSDMLNSMYENSLDFVRYKGFVMQNFQIRGNVAYMKTTEKIISESNLSFSDISRGMINSMADIKGIDIWANFTYSEDGIYAEIRSKKKTVNHIAVKYGGGGHALACGATLKNWEEADKMIEDLCEV